MLATLVGIGLSLSAQAPLVVPEVDSLEIVVVVDNFFDGFQKNEKFAKRLQMATENFDGIRVQAEHGLAYYIEAVVAGKKHKILMDYSLSQEVYGHNLKKLKLDIRDTEALLLSHGHQDHYTGLPIALKAVKKKTPFVVTNEDVFANRYFNDLDFGALDRRSIERTGAKVVLASAPTIIAESGIASGVIQRVTDYEKPPPAMMMKKDGQKVQDTFDHELALFFKVKGKGLVVITSCAHVGVVNTVRHAMKVTGEQRVLAVLGGMHLTTAPEDVIAKTIGDLSLAKPTVVAPMHCTGNRAMSKMATTFGEGYVHPSVGTRFTFAAEAAPTN